MRRKILIFFIRVHRVIICQGVLCSLLNEVQKRNQIALFLVFLQDAKYMKLGWNRSGYSSQILRREYTFEVNTIEGDYVS